MGIVGLWRGCGGRGGEGPRRLAGGYVGVGLRLGLGVERLWGPVRRAKVEP